MALNQQLKEISSYFELIKVLKFGLIIIFFSLNEYTKSLDLSIKFVFCALALINILHFFDIFSINKLIAQLYNGDLNLKYFGTNTLGQAAGKRMVGIMPNPNTNAILFCFFSLYFLPLKYEKEKLFWFVFSLTLTFMCQSRTLLISIIAIFIVIFISKLSNWKLKQWLIILSISVLAYFLAWMFSSSFFKYPIYGNSLFNGVAYESQSAMGRIEAWKFLGKMILEKPLFGYGPNKYFFYNNNIYSENEYVLYAWRYGFFGLFIYLSLFIVLLKECYTLKHLKQAKYLILIIVLFITTALTNNPFTERTISLIFAITIGIYFRLNQIQNTNFQKQNTNEIK